MPYIAEAFESFSPGLNLRDKADAVQPSEAIDLLNVDFTDHGAIKQRDGYAQFADLGETIGSMCPFYTTSGTSQLVVASIKQLWALDSAGSVVAATGDLAPGTYMALVRTGAPGAEYLYASNGVFTLRRWNGSSWAAPTATVNGSGGGAMPKPTAMAVISPSNRLVVGGFPGTSDGPGGAATNPSTVFFSGDSTAIEPERWLTSNFIQVDPGDGENVKAIVAWNNLVFIFKETKFFVVYGESVDGSGNPIFNYRRVHSGVGAVGQRAVTATPEGVYFVDRTGVFLTTGGPPKLVSDLVSPLFLGGVSSFYTGGQISAAFFYAVSLHYFNHRLYLGYTDSGSTNNKTLVYDTRYEWWSVHTLPATTYASYRISSSDELMFAADGANTVNHFGSTYINDNGAPISSRWRSGWIDYGIGNIKRIRESKLWGTGKVYLAIAPDFRLETGTQDLCDFTVTGGPTWNSSRWGVTTWGAGVGLRPVLRRRAVRGTTFSTGFFNSVEGQPWSVSRCAHHLASQRIPSPIREPADMT